MGTCTNHPDRETSYMCSKHGVYMCEECLECHDPDIYYKFRSALPHMVRAQAQGKGGA